MASAEIAEKVAMEKLELSKLAEKHTPDKTILATRYFGKIFYPELLNFLQKIGPAKVACFSFAGIKVMDGSFADEVFGNLVVARANRQLSSQAGTFYLAELNENSLDNLQMALNFRPEQETSSSERLRNCVLPVLFEDGELRLVGKAEESLKQTFELLRKHRELNARQLADMLELNINAASTRLKVLADLALAFRAELRDAQGKQFTYRWLL